ncbi:MAG TPA: hypothetical protein VEJ20_00315 [Candidatus Eremiobacteraceae bacterium]|nr:hypothetical protein [Candidatus Eremiobacteraceae bacterium]
MDAPPPTPAPAATTTTPADDRGTRIAAAIAHVRATQSIGGAFAGGSLGAVIGAVLWALITVVTNFVIGWEAIGVGFLVGFGVRRLGGGIDPVFGYIGAGLSLAGIVLGNILIGVYYVANNLHVPFMNVAAHLTMQNIWLILTAEFQPIDLLFYAFGVYYGYRYSIKPITI